MVGDEPGAGAAFEGFVPPLEVGFFLSRAFAEGNLSFVLNDGPESRDLAAADFAGMRRKVVVDGRRIRRHEAMQGIFS